MALDLAVSYSCILSWEMRGLINRCNQTPLWKRESGTARSVRPYFGPGQDRTGQLQTSTGYPRRRTLRRDLTVDFQDVRYFTQVR